MDLEAENARLQALVAALEREKEALLLGYEEARARADEERARAEEHRARAEAAEAAAKRLQVELEDTLLQNTGWRPTARRGRGVTGFGSSRPPPTWVDRSPLRGYPALAAEDDVEEKAVEKA
ncbi:MAG: hypothetical protein H6735_23695 [Alphaproteobacteria bacterium]|nr:hypothetical protein [Alphaproteobacteria bacterium]